MSAPEQQPNISNLQALENEMTLTRQEIEEFRKLPKEEQGKQRNDKLARLIELQNKLDQAIQEAVRTGQIDESKKIKDRLEKEISDLESMVEEAELPTGASLIGTVESKPDMPANDIRRIFKNQGIDFQNSAEDLLDKTHFSTENLKYRLVKISVDSLGFPQGATVEQIYLEAKSLGLKLCPAEVGPLLRLQYPNLKRGEWLYIAMEAIETNDGREHLYRVGHYSGKEGTREGRLWLGTYPGELDHNYSGEFYFVFQK